MLETAQRVADAQPEKVHVALEVGDGLARQVQHERQLPHFVADVAGHDLDLVDVGVGDAQLQHVAVRLTVVSAPKRIQCHPCFLMDSHVDRKQSSSSG